MTRAGAALPHFRRFLLTMESAPVSRGTPAGKPWATPLGRPARKQFCVVGVSIPELGNIVSWQNNILESFSNCSLSFSLHRTTLASPFGRGASEGGGEGSCAMRIPSQSRLTPCQLSQRESQGRSRASAINYNLAYCKIVILWGSTSVLSVFSLPKYRFGLLLPW